MDIKRRDGESQFQYHKRLIEGKLVDKTLADVDYSELAELVYDQPYSSEVARKMFYGSRKTIELMEAEGVRATSGEDVLSELDAKMIEFKKEQQKFLDQRTAFNKVVRERSRQEELNEILEDSIKHGDLPRLDYVPVRIEPSSNDILVSLNDIHYGSYIRNAWNSYDPDICRDMMCRYLDKVLAIAETHGSENCIVYNCGDCISGNIHLTIQIANKENVVEQIKGVSELIANFLAELSSHFKTVRYVSVAGNHSRIAKKENAPMDERLDDLIEWYLSARLQHFENIEIETNSRLDPTMFVTEIRGLTYCGVHGDYDPAPPKIAALQAMVRKPIYAILCGHFHHNMINEVQGVKTLMAGSFQGIDDFCVQKRIYGKPQQLVCICDDNGIVCHYDVEL